MNLLFRLSLVFGHCATMLGDLLITLATIAMFTVVDREFRLIGLVFVVLGWWAWFDDGGPFWAWKPSSFRRLRQTLRDYKSVHLAG